jgi:hypothetical protein
MYSAGVRLITRHGTDNAGQSPLLVFAERALRVIAPDAYRRFPPLWTVEEQEACFTVRDRGGQALAYVYFEDELGRRSAAKLLTDEAQRIAANIAKLPELLKNK